jgi:hypothetical protein
LLLQNSLTFWLALIINVKVANECRGSFFVLCKNII